MRHQSILLHCRVSFLPRLSWLKPCYLGFSDSELVYLAPSYRCIRWCLAFGHIFSLVPFGQMTMSSLGTLQIDMAKPSKYKQKVFDAPVTADIYWSRFASADRQIP